jgi:hypothetical protein
MVMRSPVVPPLADIVGVVSLVLSSLLDAPRSDAASRSGNPGADGADVSRLRVIDDDELD